jgi:CheY-like chemotaxis protein
MNRSNLISGPGSCRILVVEDEPVLAMLLQDALSDMGCSVVFAHEVREATQLAKTEALECGFLDVKIGNETVVPVADALRERNIPFVFSSNFGKELLPQRYRNHVMLPKPYFPDDIAHVFRTQLNIKLSPARSGL